MQKDMHDPEHSTEEISDAARTSWRTVLGGVVAVVLLAILGYVATRSSTCSTRPTPTRQVLTATVEDKVEADGVVLFNETLIPGSGDMGLSGGGRRPRVGGTVVAEVYTNSGQSALRASLTSLNEQIELLQRAENVSSTQVDTMIQERTTALYDLLDAAGPRRPGRHGHRPGGLPAGPRTRSWWSRERRRTLPPRSRGCRPRPPSSRASWACRPRTPRPSPAILSAAPAPAADPAGRDHPGMDAPTLQAALRPGWTPPSPAVPARWCRASAGATAASARRNRPRNCCGPTAPPSPARCASSSRPDRRGFAGRADRSDHRRGVGAGPVRPHLRLGHGRGCSGWARPSAR